MANSHADAAEHAEGSAEGGGDAKAHRDLGALWWDKLGRIDKAVAHLRRAWEMSHEAQPMEELRRIYAAVGDEDSVRGLYEEELAVIGDADPARAAGLAHALGVLLARRGDPAAAPLLERAQALVPGDDKRERLAEVYATQGDVRAVGHCLALAAARRSAGDTEAAATFLRRALGIDPASEAARRGLEEVLGELGRWGELERLYAQLADQVPEEAPALIAKRARILQDKLGDRERAKRTWESLGDDRVADEPLRTLYTKDGDWEKLAALLERRLGPERLPADLLALATILREHVGDDGRAALLLHEVLAADPRNTEALARYTEHFRERRDWRGLVELQTFAADSARGLPPAERVRRLEELADTAEQRLGDVERAQAAWQAVLEIEPLSSRAREAERRLQARAKMWESLIGVLEKEAAGATGVAAKAEAKKRMAAVYRERQVDPRRAIALYEEALGLVPGDAAALKALADLYEREGDDAGVTRTLRRQIDGASKSSELVAAQKVERQTLLRRLATLYVRLGDVEGVVYATTAMLELVPADREALDRLERTLERAGDLPRLEQALNYRAEVAAGPAERARALRRLARLADGREDSLAAMERWEKTLRAAPNDAEALEALSLRYQEAQRWSELAGVLERQIVVRGADKVDPVLLRRHARVIDAKLGDLPRAVKAWKRLLEVLPRDREALEALARRLGELGSLRELSDVLGRQAALFGVDDRPHAVEVALARAEILEERLGAPDDAAAVLEELLAGPGAASLPAHGRLIRLALARGDSERAVRLLERVTWLAAEPGAKIATLLEIGAQARDRLGDERRALQAFERVLELDPRHPGALAAAAALYSAVGEHTRHVATLERLAHERQGSERQLIYRDIARAVETELGDARDGFRWRWRAHHLGPSAETLDELRAAAERGALWPELAEVLEHERRQAVRDPLRFVTLSRELAGLYERRLGDVARTLSVLGEAAAAVPDDDALLGEAEQVAATAGTDSAWRAVLATAGALLVRRDRAGRLRLHERRARLLEERLGDDGGALDERLAGFELEPQPAARVDIERLAARTSRWEDVVRVDAALFARETTPAGRVHALADAATIIEEKLADPARAFQGWLQAFRLVPDDADVQAQLWRLARIIGRYPEPRAATPRPAAHPPATPRASAGVDPTIQLTVEDLLAERPDATIQLDAADLMALRGDQTIELGAADLQALGGPAGTTLPPPVPAPAAGPTPPRRRYVSAWEELAAAHEALLSAPRSSRILGLYRAAEVWERGAGDVPRAFDTLGQALALDHGAAETRARLANLAAAHDEQERLAALYLDAAESATSAPEMASLLHEVATLRVEQNRLGDAEELYRRILGIVPDDQTARERLLALHRAAARWSDVAATLEERTDPRLGDAAPEAERPELLRELARLYENELGKPYEAIGALERLVAASPDDVDAWNWLAAIYEKLGRWAKVIEALGRVAEVGERTVAREARRRIGRLYEHELEHPERAIEAYSAIAAAWPDDGDAFEALDRLLEQTGRHGDLAEILRKRAALAGDPGPRVWLLRRRAELLGGPLERQEEAVACLRQAHAIAPDDDALADELTLALLGRGAAHEAATLLGERARTAAAPGDAAALLVREAEVREAALGDAAGARHALRLALDAVPDHPTARAALARLMPGAAAAARSTGAAPRPAAADVGTAAERLERRLAEPLAADERARVLAELAGLAAGAGAVEIATRRAEEALAADPTSLEAILARADLYAGQPAELEAFLSAARTRLDRAPADARAEVDRRLAIAAEALGRADEAFLLYGDALRSRPDDVGLALAQALNRLRAGRFGEAAELVVAATRMPEAVAHGTEVADALADVAESAGAAGRPEAAAGLWAAALALCPDHARSLGGLAAAALAAGENVQAAQLFERHARADAARRVELYEAAADLWKNRVGDPVRARKALEAAVDGAAPLAAEHAPLLRRLAAAQREAGDPAAAARTTELLAAFAADAGARASVLLAAAQAWRDAGLPDRAAAVAGRALDLSPSVEKTTPPPRLRLSTADGEMSRRRLREAVAARRDPADMLALARLLAIETEGGPVDEDGARALFELAAALGAPLGADDRRYLYAHPARTLAPDEPYEGTLDEAFLADPADGVWPRALAVLAPVLPAAPLPDLPVADPAAAAAQIFQHVTPVLGAPPATLLAGAGPDVSVHACRPPVVVLGERQLAVEAVDPLTDAELRFVLGRAAFLTLPGRLPSVLDDDELSRLVGLARALAGPDPLGAEAEALAGALPARARRRLHEILGAAATPFDAVGYRTACFRAADRAGLLLAGHAGVALHLAGAAPHLVELAASSGYLAARARLGVGATR